MAGQGTASTGKQGELKVIGELLKEGCDVYTPLVDVHGIDCVIRTDYGYKEIQIKTREKISTVPLFDVKKFEPRDNFFIICYNTNEPYLWVIPFKVFKDNARLMKSGRYGLVLGNRDSTMRSKLQPYKDNFIQLKEGTKEAAIELRRSPKKSSGGWRHLKEAYPTAEAVDAKLLEATTKGYSEAYIKVLRDLKRYWERHR